MKQIPLTQGKFALVDDEDYDFLMQWKWHINSWGYAMRNTMLPNKKRKKLWMHRIINNTPEHLDTDHRDNNHLNNQRYNLRDATRGQNETNKCTRKGKIHSKYKGVTFHKKNKNYIAQINHKKQHFHIGSFQEEDMAAYAYNKKAIELHGEFARLNIILPRGS